MVEKTVPHGVTGAGSPARGEVPTAGDGVEFVQENVVLREEVRRLREQLTRLRADARQDEEAAVSLERLEQFLVTTRPLAELLPIVLDGYRIAFSLDAVSLLLVDPERELGRLAADANAHVPDGLVLVKNDALLVSQHGAMRRPVFGSINAARDARLFGRNAAGLGSVALLPILRQDALVGSVNLGSRDPTRFSVAVGSPFLRRLPDLLAICLENAVFLDRLTGVGLTDPLTGAANRRYFEKRLAEEVHEVLRHPAPLSCLMLDLDHFKRVNDAHGHHAGDHVLKQVSATMRAMLRASDGFARYDGGAFVALLPGAGGAQAGEVAQRIRARIAAQMFRLPADKETRLTVSVGLSALEGLKAEGPEDMAREMVAGAGTALHRAKQEGRNRVVAVSA